MKKLAKLAVAAVALAGGCVLPSNTGGPNTTPWTKPSAPSSSSQWGTSYTTTTTGGAL